MTTTSLLPTVKRAFLDALAPDIRLHDVQLEYAPPALLPDREAIFIRRSAFNHEPGPLRSGRAPRDESGFLTVYLHTAVQGSTPEEADVRAFELFAVIEDVLAEDGKLGIEDVSWAQTVHITEGLGDPVPDDEGFEGILRINLAYKARLT